MGHNYSLPKIEGQGQWSVRPQMKTILVLMAFYNCTFHELLIEFKQWELHIVHLILF